MEEMKISNLDVVAVGVKKRNQEASAAAMRPAEVEENRSTEVEKNQTAEAERNQTAEAEKNQTAEAAATMKNPR